VDLTTLIFKTIGILPIAQPRQSPKLYFTSNNGPFLLGNLL